jgi:AcrR family transcriptional regulator
MLIAEKGVHAFSVAEITRRLGVAGSAPYQHFRSRDELLAATAAQLGRQLAKDMKGAVRKATGHAGVRADATEALAAAAAAYVTFIARHRVGVDFIFSADLVRLRHPELIDAGRAVMDVLLPLSISAVGCPAAAVRLLEQHIAAAHGLGRLYIDGFAQRGLGSIESIAADAAQLAHVLTAAAVMAVQAEDATPSMTTTRVAS